MRPQVLGTDRLGFAHWLSVETKTRTDWMDCAPVPTVLSSQSLNFRSRQLSSLVQVVLPLHACPQLWTGSEGGAKTIRHVSRNA